MMKDELKEYYSKLYKILLNKKYVNYLNVVAELLEIDYVEKYIDEEISVDVLKYVGFKEIGFKKIKICKLKNYKNIYINKRDDSYFYDYADFPNEQYYDCYFKYQNKGQELYVLADMSIPFYEIMNPTERWIHLDTLLDDWDVIVNIIKNKKPYPNMIQLAILSYFNVDTSDLIKIKEEAIKNEELEKERKAEERAKLEQLKAEEKYNSIPPNIRQYFVSKKISQIQQSKILNLLKKEIRIQESNGIHIYKIYEWIEDLIKQGSVPRIKIVEKINTITRRAYNRMDGKQQAKLEEQKVTYFVIVLPDETYFTVNKTQYDYADYLYKLNHSLENDE